jgi:hypothetical protein
MITPLKIVIIGLSAQPNRGAELRSASQASSSIPLTYPLITSPNTSHKISFKMFKKEYAQFSSLLSILPVLARANKNSISPGSKSKVKSSVQRSLRTQLITTYPLLAPHIDEIIPKKEQLDAMKMYPAPSSPQTSLPLLFLRYTRSICSLSTIPNPTLTLSIPVTQTRQSNALSHWFHTTVLPAYD